MTPENVTLLIQTIGFLGFIALAVWATR